LPVSSSRRRPAGKIRASTGSPAADATGKRFTVTMTAEADRPVFFTTDGSEPDSSSSRYREPLTVTAHVAGCRTLWRTRGGTRRQFAHYKESKHEIAEESTIQKERGQ